MSFLLHELHEQQRHAQYFICRAHNGPTVCLACFLHSLADPLQLASRKAYALREFIGLFASDPAECHQPLHGLLTQHASVLVNGFLSAIASTQDTGLSQVLHEAAACMCRCACDFLPELFTERLLQLLLELAWPGSAPDAMCTAEVQATAAVASCLQLLQELICTHSTAAGLLVQALQTSGDLAAVVTEGLASGLEAVVVPLLHIFSQLAHSSSVAVAAGPVNSRFPTGLAKDLFIGLLQLLPDVLAPELKVLVVQVLLKLADTGYAVEQAAQLPTAPAQLLASSSQLSQQQQQQQHNPQQQALANTIMTGLKPLLLDTDPALQLLGAQSMMAIAARAPALLLQYLVDADACEHVYEVLRGTLASCNMRAKLAAAALADEQRRRGPGAATAGRKDAATAAGAAAELEVVSEGLQSAAVTVMRYLATQGPSFLEHFHFGVDTLTDLLQHATNTANSPLLADTLTLLTEVTAPHNPGSLLLPTAALVRLATAAAAVLPVADAAAQVGGGAPEGMNNACDMQQGGGLHPSPELQAAYGGACTLLTNLCLKWGSSSSSWTALEPHITATMHKSLAAVSLLSSRSLAGGYLAAACKFVTVTGQLLVDVLAARSVKGTEYAAAKPAVNDLPAAGHGGHGQSKLKSSNKRGQKPNSAAGGSDKPFAKRRQQQQQATSGLMSGQYGSTTCDLAQQQTQVDNVLSLVESVLQHLVPAAATLLTAANCELAAASQQQQQLEGAVFIQLLQAVQGVLLMVLTAGAANSEVASFLPSFCSQLLGVNKWSSIIWSIMASHALPTAAAVDAWTVLLLAAVHLEGAAFMQGVPHYSLPSLAASLAGKARCSTQLLQLMCASSQDPAAAAAAAAPSHGRNSSRQAAAMAARPKSADIRRFCGVSDMHKAAMCILAAAVRCGDVSWPWLDILHTLNAAVGQAGPGMLSQPELLCNIVLLYCQVEQQLAADMASQQCSTHHTDGVMLTNHNHHQQQQYMSNGPASAQDFLCSAVQQLPAPHAVLYALQKLGKSLPHLHPHDLTAQWIMARASQLPACAPQLLQRWMTTLLPTAMTADADSAGSGVAGCIDLQGAAELEQQQQELSAAVITVLSRYPAALREALLVAKQCLEAKQQVLLAGWLAVFTGVICQRGNDNSGLHPQQSSHLVEYLEILSYQNTDKHAGPVDGSTSSTRSSMPLLPDLLFGPSGLHELLRRSLLVSLSAAASSVGASCVVVCCNTALLAVTRAAATTAAAGSGGGPVDESAGHMERLMQHGVQQVHMAATRLVKLPAQHPVHQQLLLSTANAANALMHCGLLQRQDPELLMQLAECSEVQQLMEKLRAEALGVNQSGKEGLPAQHTVQQQLHVLQCSRTDAEVAQLVGIVLKQCWFCSSSSTQSAADTAAAAATAIGALPGVLSQQVQKENLLLAALHWWQHRQVLLMTGCARAAAAMAAEQAVFGMSPPQLVLLAQNAGGSLMSLMLLDTTRLLLHQQAAVARASCDGGLPSSTNNQPQPWLQALAVLQNVVVAAATGSSGNTLYQEAAVSCLAAIYDAAAAGMHHCSTNMAGSLSVLRSAWNLPVLKVALDRLCQQATYLRSRAAEAEQAAALAAASLQQTASSSFAGGSHARQHSQWFAWLDDADCQQRVHLWCADARLLLGYIKMWLAAAETKNQSLSANGQRDSHNDKLLAKLQQLVGPYLEQQQLASFICWAAAQQTSVEAALAAASRCQQQQQDQRHHQRSESAYSAVNSTVTVNCGLQYCLSDVALELLAGFLDTGCLAGQLPWLHQQLQQHLWAAAQQQQGLTHSQCEHSTYPAIATGQGNLLMLSPLEVVEGVSVGLLRPCMMQLLLTPWRQNTLSCQTVLDAVATELQAASRMEPTG